VHRRILDILNVALFSLTLVWMLVGFMFWSQPDEVLAGENRRMASLPPLTFDAMFGGAYSNAVEEYIADHFPMRDKWVTVHATIRNLLGVRSDDGTFYDVEVNEGEFAKTPVAVEEVPDDFVTEEMPDELAAQEGQADQADPGQTASVNDPVDGEAADDEGDFGDTVAVPPDVRVAGSVGAASAQASTNDTEDPDEQVTSNRGILVYKGRAMQTFGAGPKGARLWAKTLNAYRSALPESVRLYAVVVPSAAEFYSPDPPRRRSRPEKPNIDATYEMLAPGISRVDAYGEIQAHIDEYLYFFTDHHWTALGAYYTYRALCKAAGLEPVPLDKMEKRVRPDWLGSLYGYTRDSGLKRQKDQVEYWLPSVSYETRRFEAGPDAPPKGTRTRLLFERAPGYGVFLGGDHPLMVVKTSNKNGRRVLLLKNSYGNPFGVFLVSSFEQVLIVDYRYFDGKVTSLVREYGITDVIILNGVFTANSRYHPNKIMSVLRGPPASRPSPPPDAPAPDG